MANEPQYIELYDTTLRDGSQSEVIDFSLPNKISLAQRLDSLHFDYIEGGFPNSNPKDREFFEQIQSEPLSHAKICAFGMTRRKGVSVEEDAGLESLISSNAPVVTLVGKSSRFQVTDVINATLEENLQMISESVAWLTQHGKTVFFDAEHFFDGALLDLSYSLACLEAAQAAGARRIILCDTNGGTMPSTIGTITSKVVESLGRGVVGIHSHNDCGMAVANALAAVEAGAVQVQGTINGFGERCGNADLTTVAANLVLKMQNRYTVLAWDSLTYLTQLSRFVYELVNLPPTVNQPFVGQAAFAHKGGMHVSGINRNTGSYEHIDPSLVGNERRILISELAGAANLKALEDQYNLPADKAVREKILNVISRKERAGYKYETAGGSFALLAHHLAGNVRSHFNILSWHVSISQARDANSKTITEAIVKYQVHLNSGECVVYHEVAEGDGPVDALNTALRKGLIRHYPELSSVKLVDYKVRVINADAGTAAVVRVLIDSMDEDSSGRQDAWGTVGVSENIVEASLEAIKDSLEYKLHNKFNTDVNK